MATIGWDRKVAARPTPCLVAPPRPSATVASRGCPCPATIAPTLTRLPPLWLGHPCRAAIAPPRDSHNLDIFILCRGQICLPPTRSNRGRLVLAVPRPDLVGGRPGPACSGWTWPAATRSDRYRKKKKKKGGSGEEGPVPRDGAPATRGRWPQ